MKRKNGTKITKRITASLLCLLMLGSEVVGDPGGTADSADGGDSDSFVAVDNAGIETSKTISYDETNGYTLRMENYVTGSTITSTVTTMKATDFVLAMDISHSMPYCINCGDNSAVDSVSTGKFLNRAYCKTYAQDIDTSLVYYTDWDMPTALYYCETCGRWYTEQHTGDSHDGGTEYLPAYYSNYWTASEQAASHTKFTQFYSLSGNVNCTGGESCTEHGNWRHPIYADQLDYSAEYAWDAGKTGGDYHAAWCDVCGVWRRCSDAANTSHADGGDHELGYVYCPFRTAEDNTTDTKVCIFRPPCVSRMTAAKNAISAFVDEVYRMALGPDGITGTDDDVKHRVAIVGFGGDDPSDAKVDIDTEDKDYTRTGIYSLWDKEIYETDGEDINNFKSYYVFGMKNSTTPGDEADNAGYYYSHALRDVTSSKEMDVIQAGIADLNYNYGTYINFAMVMAKEIFSSAYTEDPVGAADRNRVAVMFTDGEPDGDGEYDYDLADESIQPAYDVKNSTTYGATVYSVGIFAGADASTIWPLSSNKKTDNYMHMLSSNFPTAWEFYETGSLANDAYVKRDPTSANEKANWSKFEINDVNPNLLQRDEYGNLVIDADGNYILDTTKTGYYLTADDADSLVNAFEGIATESISGGASVTLDTATVVQDTLSDKWEIAGDASSVTAYTMTYTGDNADGSKAWTKDADTYTPTVNGNTVQVTGFDFSANYVGKDVANGVETPHGKKLVLEIPVKPTAGNLGGTAQETNVPAASGILYNGEIQEHFGVPTVDIPTTVSLAVQVAGANVDASTLFDFDLTMQCSDGYESSTAANGNYLKLKEKGISDSSSLSSGGTDSFTDVIVGKNIVITEKNVSDYKVEVSLDNGTTWTELTVATDGTASGTYTVTAGMQIIVRNTLQRADLTITKTINRANPDQSFIFTVSGNGLEIDVVIPADAFTDGATTASVTVKDMEIGDYTVREQTEWLHRYEPTAISAAKDTDAVVNLTDANITVTVTPDGETVTFTNDRTDPYWLSGDCWSEYWFGGTDGIVKRDGNNTVLS